MLISVDVSFNEEKLLELVMEICQKHSISCDFMGEVPVVDLIITNKHKHYRIHGDISIYFISMQFNDIYLGNDIKEDIEKVILDTQASLSNTRSKSWCTLM